MTQLPEDQEAPSSQNGPAPNPPTNNSAADTVRVRRTHSSNAIVEALKKLLRAAKIQLNNLILGQNSD
jgi:hypothetical protein